MPFARTYVEDYNVTPAAATPTLAERIASLLLEMKLHLTGINPANVTGAWTVISSCDGDAQFGAADYWATSEDVIRSNGGNHSWIVLRDPGAGMLPGGHIYLIIDWSTGHDYTCNFQLGDAAPSGGALNAAPTFAAGHFLDWPDQQISRNADSVNLRFHAIRSTVGSFIFETSYAGSDRCVWQFVHLETERFFGAGVAIDNWPHIAWNAYDDSTPGVLFADLAGAVCQAFDRSGVAQNCVPACLSTPANQPLITITPSTGIRNDGATQPDFPIMAFFIVSGGLGVQVRGWVIDVRYAPTGAGCVSGRTEPPSPATPVSAVMGCIWQPASVTPTA